MFEKKIPNTDETNQVRLDFKSLKELEKFIEELTILKTEKEASAKIEVKTLEKEDMVITFKTDFPKEKKKKPVVKVVEKKPAPHIDAQAIYIRPIACLELDRQVEHVLEAEKMTRVGDVARMTEDQLLALPKIGRAAVASIKRALNGLGITKLGLVIPDWK